MSTPTSASSMTTSRGGALAAPDSLQSPQGRTTIADGVVQKIAGLAAREVAGVHALGGGTARALGSLRERIPGASQSTGQGVAVEVGETQAAIDLDMVTEYGVSIAEVARAVRRNVIDTVEGMTGLQVTEVNVSVNDIHLPTDDAQDAPEPARVQ
ncbi:Asp23/Gls24 family envelope stress response protein [Cellulomonas sp. NS3]|uniref:Asp23/Gls24 family envelope stress response protein n=1 Tax=Cellulomonas sp. NS3 TaxID=2973977 RepID=UPI00216154DE|nr:Asp23/Gls24 family envelope stress response protein [Cellulomonas sp. NS3]